MKKLQLIIACLLILETSSLFSQCIAEAGNDTIICSSNEFDTLYLGGQPTAQFGTPPYQYTWTCNYQFNNLTWTASDFLNDTTSPNPQLVSFMDDYLEFKLTVTDSLGEICRDTVVVGYSSWIWTLDQKIRFITQGDSVQLYRSIYGGIPPLSYEWKPSHGLSNTFILNTWASPDSSILYELVVTDSAGCIGTDNFHIIVYPLGVNQVSNDDLEISISPNPMTETSNIFIKGITRETLTFRLFNLSGNKVFETDIQDGYQLNKRNLPSGPYTFSISDKNEIFIQDKLIIK